MCNKCTHSFVCCEVAEEKLARHAAHQDGASVAAQRHGPHRQPRVVREWIKAADPADWRPAAAILLLRLAALAALLSLQTEQ